MTHRAVGNLPHPVARGCDRLYPYGQTGLQGDDHFAGIAFALTLPPKVEPVCCHYCLPEVSEHLYVHPWCAPELAPTHTDTLSPALCPVTCRWCR